MLDAFKRCYSNEDTATKAIPHFWENFDKEGWSIWKAVYKYPEELKRIFMTSNLVSGMMQRLDKLRKNAFASVLILGKDNDNIIEGVWVLRGQELAFSVSFWGPLTMDQYSTSSSGTQWVVACANSEGFLVGGSKLTVGHQVC